MALSTNANFEYFIACIDWLIAILSNYIQRGEIIFKYLAMRCHSFQVFFKKKQSAMLYIIARQVKTLKLVHNFIVRRLLSLIIFWFI